MKKFIIKRLDDDSCDIFVDDKVVAHGENYDEMNKTFDFVSELAHDAQKYGYYDGRLAESRATGILGTVGAAASLLCMRKLPKGSNGWCYELGLFLASCVFMAYGFVGSAIHKNAMKDVTTYTRTMRYAKVDTSETAENAVEDESK